MVGIRIEESPKYTSKIEWLWWSTGSARSQEQFLGEWTKSK